MDNQTIISLSSFEEEGASSDAIMNMMASSSSSSSLSLSSTLSRRQERFLSASMVLSGTLSILGSATIIIKVMKNSKKNKTTPYDRLMVGLSFCDIVGGFSHVLTPFLTPGPNNPDDEFYPMQEINIWAKGNGDTCTALGTLSQFGLSAVVYNCLLSFYYLLTVRLGVKRKQFEERYEVWFHVCCLSYFFITATIGAVFEIYAPLDLGLGCWVNSFPKGCQVTGTCISEQIGWIFGGIPALFTFLCLTVNNVIIYLHVKNKLQIATPTAGSFRSSHNSINSNNNNTDENNDQNDSTNTNDGDNNGGVLNSPSRKSATLWRASTMSTSSSVSDDERRSHWQKVQTREVATQGFLYVFTFLLTFGPSCFVRIFESLHTGSIDDNQYYPALVLYSVLFPLQGFFNMFVYNRPNYTRFRIAYPEFTRLESMVIVLWYKDIPSYSEIARISTHYSSRIGQNHNHHLNRHQQQYLNTSAYKPKGSSKFSSNLAIVPEGDEENDNDEERSRWDLGGTMGGITKLRTDENDVIELCQIPMYPNLLIVEDSGSISLASDSTASNYSETEDYYDIESEDDREDNHLEMNIDNIGDDDFQNDSLDEHQFMQIACPLPKTTEPSDSSGECPVD